MNRKTHATTTGALEKTVGRVLTLGTVMSSLCLATGLAATLMGTGNRLARPLLTSGLLVLLATPVSRVVVSVVAYARSRDWLFVALTLVVLLELVASVIAALHGTS